MKHKLVVIAFLCVIGLLQLPRTSVAQPAATTLAATSVTASNATIHGTVNPNGAEAAAYFQYGLTTNYDNLAGFAILPATTTTLNLSGQVVAALRGAPVTNWTQTPAPSAVWFGLSSSADGSKLAAAIGGGSTSGGIYASTNAGVTWTQTSAPVADWMGIAASAEGTQLTAMVYGGGVYTSTNGGGTWTLTGAPSTVWGGAIASSADGRRRAVGDAMSGGGIYTSTNSGVTWTLTSATNAGWHSIASSADGMRLAALTSSQTPSVIYISINGGVTWTATSLSVPGGGCIASSADGMRLAAALFGDYIHISTNGGVTWALTSAPYDSWESIVSSADGMRLAASSQDGYIYTSTDGGSTWTQTSAPKVFWPCMASSADGTQIAAVGFGGGIYTARGATNNLTSATTYHYRVVGLNSAGTSLGNDVTFTTGPAAPTATTLPASGIMATSTTLNGTVNPNGAATSVYFRYGSTTNYGSFSATNTLAATNMTLSVSNLVASLTPNTTYHFQLVASNSVGLGTGTDLTFTTLPLPPTITTLPATSITASNATLNGSVNPNGAAASAYFQFGLTTNYGSYSATNTSPAGNTGVSVSDLISNLPLGTVYHFQLVAGNIGGISLGNDVTFATGAEAPTATTLAASGIMPTNAALNGTVNPNGAATTVYFQYGLTTSYGSYSATNTLAATNITLSVASLVGNLTANTNYHFQLVASNSAGTSVGGDLTFTTRRLPPIVTTLPATSIARTLATLNGSVNPNGLASAVYFQCGLTTNYGNDGPVIVLPPTNTEQTLTGQVLNSLFGAAGTNWTASTALRKYWNCIASSADGMRMAAVSSGIYISTNGGSTWTITSAPTGQAWQSIASSADGAQLAAVINANSVSGGIYISTNGGATWTQSSAPSNQWYSIASSADGTHLAAVVNGNGSLGGIYISTNGGATWTQTSAPVGLFWQSIASSGDGTYLAAAINSGNIYTSTNGGVTWTLTSAPSAGWNCIASSVDGARLAAVAYDTQSIYTSTDGGSTWNITSAPSQVWQSIASSADGTRLTAGIFHGGIYNSTDGGITWTQAATPSVQWQSIACSANGTQLAAVEYNGGIFISRGTTNNLTPATTYHYRVAGYNIAGAGFGNDLTFTTASPDAPTAITVSATSITSSNATLNGTVNPNGAVSTGYFQYGLTTNYDNLGGFTALPATSTAQPLPGLAVTALSGPAGSNWIQTSAPSTNWASVASSADGTHLAAAAAGGGIYTSTNGGSTWTLTGAPITNWFSMASSYDGSRLAAVVNGGLVYTSADGGITWNATSLPATNWAAIASSADGLRLVTVINAGGIYTSADGGSTWTQAGGGAYGGASIASSAGGLSLALALYGGNIWTSTNAGTTWSATSGSSPGQVAIACSADGTRLAVAIYNGGVWTSINSGSTWTEASLPGTNWTCIASSADGMRLTAGKSGGLVYTSTDGGATWTQGNAPIANWNGLATSADGTRLVAVINGGGIYTATGTSNPLTPQTTYHYRAVGVNYVGSGYGNDLIFTTAPAAPTATTLAATSLTASNATVNGTVNPNGTAATAYFQYGLTTNYGSYTTSSPLPATNAILSVADLITGLAPGTTYHFQLIAFSAGGIIPGADLQFTTASAQAASFSLNGGVKLSGGAFQFSFTNLSGTSFTVLASTNPALPLTNWTMLGAPVESPPGHYQFTDAQATNAPTRYYSVRSP